MIQYSVSALITRSAIALLVACASSTVMAQRDGLPEFLEKNIRVDATDAADGPRLHAKFNFSSDNTLITRGEMKVANDGYEDDTVIGFAPKFGDVRAKVTYNLHRFTYIGWEDQSEVMKVDVNYRFLWLQHREDELAHVSSIGIPFHLHATKLYVSYRRSQQIDAAHYVDAYQFVSKLPRLKFSATWQEAGEGTWSDINTVYRPSKSWLMKYSYHHDDTGMQRKVRSEFVDNSYHLAAEISAITNPDDQSYISGAIGIKRLMKLATLSVSLAHDGSIDSSTLFFKLETRQQF